MALTFPKMLASYLEPLNGLLTGRAEDAVMQVVDGAGSAGEGRQRGRGTHPCHCIGHCGEITPLIDSLAIIDKVLVIAQVCQRERRGIEEDRRTDRRTDGRWEQAPGGLGETFQIKGTGRGTDGKKENKRAGEGDNKEE